MNENLKDLKMNFILDGATELFLEKGIHEVTFKEIAARCGIGERTVYRYFPTRQILIAACTMRIAGQVFAAFEHAAVGSTGYEKLQGFYGAYGEILQNHPEFYVFIAHFDELLSEGSIEVPEEYVEQIRRVKALFDDAYQEGIRDGTVQSVDRDAFYYATTHACMTLCRKLACEAALIPDDSRRDLASEIGTLVEVILYRLNGSGTSAEK